MIESLVGVVELKKKDFSIVLSLSGTGIGLNVSLSQKDFFSLELNQELKLFVYTQIQAEKIKLFGFLELEQKELFELIISVKSIGSKSALALIETFSSKDLVDLILLEDLNSLSKAPSIGLKSAQRIVFELKNKIKKAGLSMNSSEKKNASSFILEAQETLISLDYSEKEIQIAFKEIAGIDNLKTEEILQISLSKLSVP